MKQINLKLPDNLVAAAQRHVENFGFRNIQDLATESIREKVFEKNEYDETFSNEEIELIDELILLSIKKKDIISEEELNKVLLA
ncbi:hypothetical protein K8R33_03140 [archaeon]|nr:hypothetical protein [archaeon]